MVRNDFTFIRRLEKIITKSNLRKRYLLFGWIEFLKEEAKINYLRN
jgi:hypothetical protein